MQLRAAGIPWLLIHRLSFTELAAYCATIDEQSRAQLVQDATAARVAQGADKNQWKDFVSDLTRPENKKTDGPSDADLALLASFFGS